MTDNLLQRAASALREETDGPEDGARFTRMRVLADVQQGQVKRRTRFALMLPLAALFATATAWGTANGKLAAAWHEVVRAIASPGDGDATRAREARRATPSATPPVVTAAASEAPQPAEAPAEAPQPAAAAEVAAPAAPPSAPASAEKAVATPRAAATASAVAPAAPPKATALDVPEVDDPTHDLYRAAHRQHFLLRDYGAALKDWDEYLRSAPDGRFALEARYNRALCLTRLGRSHDAREALTPFAEGRFGAYRQAEARALLDALKE